MADPITIIARTPEMLHVRFWENVATDMESPWIDVGAYTYGVIRALRNGTGTFTLEGSIAPTLPGPSDSGIVIVSSGGGLYMQGSGAADTLLPRWLRLSMAGATAASWAWGLFFHEDPLGR
jgi:hypothetical protein